jgi:uncharacterized phage protein gp47/JayE
MDVYENKTIAEIRDLIINSFQEKFNIIFRILPKSFIRIIAVVLAGVYITLHKEIGWLFLQLFPETAYWGTVNILGKKIRPLVKWGILIGVGEPRSGTQWRGNISVTTVHAGFPLPAGTQLKGDITGKVYITEKGITLENPVEIIPVICAETGEAGNLEAEDALTFVSPLGTVQRTAAVSEVTVYGTEDESEVSYRGRVVSRFRSPPLGGALADYRRWASDVPGVLNTYIYKDIDTPSGVFVYVSGVPAIFPDRIPTGDLLRQVGDACTYDATGKQTRKPITAVLDPTNDGSYLNVKAVSVKELDVVINGLTGVQVSDFSNAVKPVLDDYFLSRESYIRGLSDDNNKTSVVTRNSVSSAANQVAIRLKAEFDEVSLLDNSMPIMSYTLGMGGLVKMRSLIINGVLQ